jgi:hypothetical protein
MKYCPNHPERLLKPGAAICSLCPKKVSRRNDVRPALDAQLGKALREYSRAVREPMSEIVYRALISYWANQKTKAATFAVNTADLKTDEAWSAFLAESEESGR